MTGYLRRFALFDALTEADAALLERVFVVTSYAQGHVFVREGDRADAVTAALFLILEGQVSVTAEAPQGGFGVQRTLAAGQVFGAVALVADVTRTATCRALTPVSAARLDRRSFEELFRRNVGVHARYQQVIARSLAADLRDLRGLLVAALASGDEGALRERYAPRAPDSDPS
jgi:CRP-like cAMP-binding protein